MSHQLRGSLVGKVLTFPKALEMWEKKTNFYSSDRIVKELGHGCGGTVYLCEEGSCAKVMFDMEDEEQCAELAEEFNFLCAIWYSAPVDERRCFLEPLYLELHENSLVIGLEHFDGYTLRDVIKSNPGKGLLNPELASDLCATMKHLNDLSFFHADFGLHNVMVSSDFSRLCVIDYGLVYVMDKPRLFESLYEYTAPEELRKDSCVCTAEELKSLQIWNTGMVLLAMRFGILKHDFAEGENNLSCSHVTGYVGSFDLSDNSFDRAIKAALAEDPKKRRIL
ncbi:hypothetical protein MEL_170 [Melbournevirus]|uniref:hypothetical protein n=1 Tax=Melbournevirus TaxID=1560514 RepID=UPI00051F5273|nr:hypothetical protein MEL_170 [Melbournevirus]AIT54783.1 serine/threonine protein kinase [Melbournevirus]